VLGGRFDLTVGLVSGVTVLLGRTGHLGLTEYRRRKARERIGIYFNNPVAAIA